MSDKVSGKSLDTSLRLGSVGVEREDLGKFPFDAFSFSDPDDTNPVIEVVSPWKLKAESSKQIYLTLGENTDLSDSGYNVDGTEVFIYNSSDSTITITFDDTTTLDIASENAGKGIYKTVWTTFVYSEDLGLGTAAYADTGTDVGDVVVLEDVDSAPGLPAVDGSQLTGLTTSQLTDYADQGYWVKSKLVDRIVSNSPYWHVAVLNKNNELVAWCGASADGNNASGTGQLAQMPPTKIAFPSDETGSIVKAHVSMGLGVVLFDNGNLYGFGDNSSGWFGDGTTTDSYVPYLINTDVDDYANFIIGNNATYTEHFLYIIKDDTLWCAGDNGEGQLGNGTTTNILTWYKPQYSSADITGIKSLWEITSGQGWVLVELNDGTILVAGNNSKGQLGDGTTTDKTTFADVTSAWNTGGSSYKIEKVIGRIADRSDSSYDMKAWMGILFRHDTTGDTIFRVCGENSLGQLGDGTTTNRNSPYTPVFADNDNIDTVANTEHAVFVLLDTNLLWRWGRNTSGQLGNGTTSNITSPYNSASGTDIDNNCQKMYMDGWDSYNYTYSSSSFIQHTDGTVWGSGDNRYNELSIGDFTLGNKTSFTKTVLPSNLIQVSNTAESTGFGFVGLLDTGELIMWGSGANRTLDHAQTLTYRTWTTKNI